MVALSEWVISVHFQERNNIAADYIQAIQNNPAKLKAANKVIQKYNLALSYMQENNADLAIIELKRVVNMSGPISCWGCFICRESSMRRPERY